MERWFIPFFLRVKLTWWIRTLLIIESSGLIKSFGNHSLISYRLLSQKSSINKLYNLLDLLDIPIMFSLDLFVKSGQNGDSVQNDRIQTLNSFHSRSWSRHWNSSRNMVQRSNDWDYRDILKYYSLSDLAPVFLFFRGWLPFRLIQTRSFVSCVLLY